MNTMGKILVILNLLFALATGGFLVIDFATRTNWKAAYDNKDLQLKAAQSNSRTMQEGYTKILKDLQDKVAELDKARRDFKEKEDKFNLDLAGEKKKCDAAAVEANAAKTQLIIANKERERLQKEGKDLVARLEDALQLALSKEALIVKYRQEAVSAINERNSVMLRNDSLLEQVETLMKQIAKKQYGADTVPVEVVKEAREAIKAGKLTKAQDLLEKAYEKATSVTAIRDPNAPNPPSAYVEGIITKVDSKDKTLVQISIGTDSGVNQDNTLEVYRLAPKAEYLGRLKILDASPQAAVGRLIRTEFTGRHSPLQPGDKVASKIGR